MGVLGDANANVSLCAAKHAAANIYTCARIVCNATYSSYALGGGRELCPYAGREYI